MPTDKKKKTKTQKLGEKAKKQREKGKGPKPKDVGSGMVNRAANALLQKHKRMKDI